MGRTGIVYDGPVWVRVETVTGQYRQLIDFGIVNFKILNRFWIVTLALDRSFWYRTFYTVLFTGNASRSDFRPCAVKVVSPETRPSITDLSLTLNKNNFNFQDEENRVKIEICVNVLPTLFLNQKKNH